MVMKNNYSNLRENLSEFGNKMDSFLETLCMYSFLESESCPFYLIKITLDKRYLK